MKFLLHTCYVWVYIIGMILTLTNYFWIHSDILSYSSLLTLFSILFYKNVSILIHYKKATQKDYPRIEKKFFAKTYSSFRVKVFLFLIAFVLLCVIARFILHLNQWYFYSCTFFFLLLDRLFINTTCLLQIFSDPTGSVVHCCCGCPCRGWDLIMIHTPLLFALNQQSPIENCIIILSSLLSLLSFLYWEKEKYHLVEVRSKCATLCDLQRCREYLS